MSKGISEETQEMSDIVGSIQNAILAADCEISEQRFKETVLKMLDCRLEYLKRHAEIVAQLESGEVLPEDFMFLSGDNMKQFAQESNTILGSEAYDIWMNKT